MTKTGPRIRKYQPSRSGDKEAIIEICRDVYDGRDYIPRVIESYGAETDVLVETPSTSDDPRALLCGARDGSLYHIWGARTHPHARGQGIMRRMMRYVESNAGATLVSTTIRSNTPMLRLFQSEGYSEHTNDIRLWPDSSVMEEADCNMSYVLAHHSRALKQRQEQWTLSRCPSADILRRALYRARGTDDAAWLPASYEVIASDGHIVQEAIDSGNVFVSEEIDAVVAIVKDQLAGSVLSIVCAAPLLGDILGAIDDHAHGQPIKRMYVDFCGSDLPTLDFVYGHEKGWSSYLVLTKRRKDGCR